MKHCINCGNKITDNEAFCKNCGHKVKTAVVDHPKNSNSIQTEQRTEQKLKNPIPKKIKILIASIIIVIILLFSAYKTIEHLNRPSKLIASFTKALDKKEIQTLNTYLQQANTDIKIDEKETKKFINYLYDNPDVLSELKTNLKADATSLEKNNQVNHDSDQLLTIKKHGKKWLAFDNYVIQPKAIYLNLSADEDNVIASFEGESDKKLKKAEKEYTFGPFLPYEYTIKAVNKTEYATVETEETKDPLHDLSGKYISFDFEVEGDYVDIYTDYEDATIFINGKDTGVTVEENNTIQPIQVDGSMRIHLERDDNDKKVKSNTITLNSSHANDSIDIYFNSDFDDYFGYDEEDDIKHVINEHYVDIKNSDYDSAYQYFSDEKRSEITVDKWSAAYPSIIYENTPTIHDIELIDDTHAIADITLFSHSEEKDGSESKTTFIGNLQLIKENGTWKLDKSKLKEE